MTMLLGWRYLCGSFVFGGYETERGLGGTDTRHKRTRPGVPERLDFLLSTANNGECAENDGERCLQRKTENQLLLIGAFGDSRAETSTRKEGRRS